jgi:hypothetical protein
MNPFRMALLCAIGMLGLVQGCGLYPVDPRTVVLAIEDDGTSAFAYLGDRIVIVLPDTSGSAYAWQIVGYDSAVIAFEQGKNVAAPGAGTASPAAFEAVVFVAVGDGTTPLTLEYRLIGTPVGSGVDTFSVTISTAGR